ncbi:MAG: hypothetical protein BMS9Abin12_1618 [Acidimicrobiia bacterium]|nr:MAG: hypothetical protein BMS9Abin12_1618 [Acidimicrobiia bacterium]
MESADQWNWVTLAYGVAYFVLVVYAVSIALRITRARKRLGDTP